MKVFLVVFISLIVSISSAQSYNYGLVYKSYNTTIYNPQDSSVLYQINDSNVVRLAKTNASTCYVENVGDFYLKDESINSTGSTINSVDSTFIFIGESKMHQFNLTNGSVISSLDLFNPLVNTSEPSYFNNFIFNPSDTTIYGLSTRQNSAGFFGNYLASINPFSGLITEISANSISQSILMAGATIDPYQMVYYFANDSAMVGIDLYDGSIYSSATFVYPPNFTQFGNFAYSCANNTIYGLLFREYTTSVPDPFNPGNFINQLDSTKLFLGTVDPATGQVSSVGPNPIDCLSSYVMNSGGAVDPAIMAYYFNDGEKYIGVSLSTGLVESSCIENFEDGSQFILFRNSTNCASASRIRLNPFLNVTNLVSTAFKLYPNPSSGNFSIQSNYEPIQTIEIITIDGNVIKKLKLDNTLNNTVEIKDLPRGIYLVGINNRNFKKIVVN